MSCPWPPTAEDLNVTEAQTVVPLELYNLVSWIIGATEEPTLEHFVNIADDLHLKVLSVCQDIVYLASKGRKQTPKSLCLGLTVRHLTGSSRIVSLLNKLGHCASWDTVLSLDTSLAQLTLMEDRDKVPKGFSKRAPTTLVWDNIDSGEETIRPWNYSSYKWNYGPEFCQRDYVHSHQTATEKRSFLIQSSPPNPYRAVPSVQKARPTQLGSTNGDRDMQNGHPLCCTKGIGICFCEVHICGWMCNPKLDRVPYTAPRWKHTAEVSIVLSSSHWGLTNRDVNSQHYPEAKCPDCRPARTETHSFSVWPSYIYQSAANPLKEWWLYTAFSD